MNFKNFLVEKTEKHAVLAFGRLSPPTTGHEKLVNKVKDVAKEHNASHHIVLSHTQDKKKNPLTAEQKQKHAKRFFPGANITTSSKDEPTILHHAARLHKQGITHLHVVGGSDRTEEYHKLLQQYNGVKSGHGHYNFKKITVHSSGERDPDAEGTEGMSASKMRKHASENNYKEFKKGVPKHVSDEHAKELFHDVRKGMQVKESEDINDSFEMLMEGVHDQGIFKAVFLAGGPGSGKDYVMNKTLDGHGLTEINSDKALEYLMDKHNLNKKMPKKEEEQRNIIRGRAKNMTELRQRLAIEGRNGLIINGTGEDLDKVKKIKSELEKIGYGSKMVMVHSSDEVSKQRNIARGKRGGRTIPEKIRKEKWQGAQNNRSEFAKMFGNDYHEYDNSHDAMTAHPTIRAAKEQELLDLHKHVKDFVANPTDNEKAQKWIAGELQKKDTEPVKRSGAERTPHPDSQAAKEASEKGLKFYGHGRYGQKGQVTHRAIQDKLVEIPKEKPQQPKVPTQGSSYSHTPTPLTSKQKKKLKTIQSKSKLPKDIKKVNEEFEQFLSEQISITISGDTPEEVKSALKLLKNTESDVDESYSLSDVDAMSVLTLGKGLMKEENENYIKDMSGKPRIFHLRTSAAKEAHQKNGTIVPHPSGKGYIVKIKEKQNVQEAMGISNTTSNQGNKTSGSKTGSSRTNSNTTDTRSDGIASSAIGEQFTSNRTSKKITLKEIREKQKTVIESIDQGIEPGLSMAGAGESPARDTGEKIDKKKFGKASQVAETIGAGGEDASSMSDFNQETLKQKGINLKTFKSKKFVG
jgi:dephospho-CoA kinase